MYTLSNFTEDLISLNMVQMIDDLWEFFLSETVQTKYELTHPKLGLKLIIISYILGWI